MVQYVPKIGNNKGEGGGVCKLTTVINEYSENTLTLHKIVSKRAQTPIFGTL